MGPATVTEPSAGQYRRTERLSQLPECKLLTAALLLLLSMSAVQTPPHFDAQAMCPSKLCTSGTSCVAWVRAAAPHTPRLKGIRRQPRVP